MDVLVTGCDTDLGRTIAQSFHDAGHKVYVSGRRRDELEVLAKELDTDVFVFDSADPGSVAALHGQVPAHLDTIVNVPAPAWTGGDPRTYTLDDHAAEWRALFDAGLVSPVLTVQVLGDHMRSGGSIITVIPDPPSEGGAASAVKAAVSDWTAGQANHFGIRGITINAVAVGRGFERGYEGLSSTPSSVSAEISRLSLFLTTPAARHITGQTLHVSHGALANFG
ncbi:SDR family oxidoreductase [Mycolicibacterium parafortuitum]|uniref:Putative oxidoreductase [Mycobacterium tuberculosis H37Rv] n=1 Tax=Mycolicibacterium parafortuitum TaxID=39692 RepID=A0A375YMN3_MYCPF|nr:SDR family oxidoreductase [Mycolicibacterium parafortuitum]ORB29835.1 short-chain dehydrogenase [Mycolicibacterium parafortuitum]SRX82333.1 putative oxidoreductase [Mycobacterium tuberculosis H37Rv] [Mycolicibacterium parafortuitum]